MEKSVRFLDELLDGGSGYEMNRVDGGATLRPVGSSDKALKVFQRVVDRVRRHEGDGYAIHLAHECGDRPWPLVDCLILTVEEQS